VSEVLSDVEVELGCKIVVDLVVVVGNILAISEFDVGVGSLLGP